jgi:hypothetical protein
MKRKPLLLVAGVGLASIVFNESCICVAPGLYPCHPGECPDLESSPPPDLATKDLAARFDVDLAEPVDSGEDGPTD